MPGPVKWATFARQSFASASAFALVTSWPGMARAQEAATDVAASATVGTGLVDIAPEVATIPETICMQGKVRGGKDEGLAFDIAVPASEQRKYLDRGFSVSECGKAKAEVASLKVFCELAEARDPASNAGIWQRFSFTPEEACSNLRRNSLPIR